MCECIDIVKERCKKYGKEVKIVGTSFYVGKDNKFHDFMIGKVRYTDNKGKKKSMDLIFSYCPFCGQKYDFRRVMEIQNANG